LVCGFLPQKQKVATYLDENDDELLAYPAWVVSDDAGSLWKNGVVPPPAIQLSPVAARRTRRGFTAPQVGDRATVEQMQPQMPAVPPARPVPAAVEPRSSVQMCQQVEVVRQMHSGPAPVFDPAVVLALKCKRSQGSRAMFSVAHYGARSDVIVCASVVRNQ
jgi:hypothetical protein